MVLSVYTDLDFEGFMKLFERLFFLAVCRIDISDSMVRFSDEWMFIAANPELDLEAFVMLKQRVFIVTLPV